MMSSHGRAPSQTYAPVTGYAGCPPRLPLDGRVMYFEKGMSPDVGAKMTMRVGDGPSQGTMQVMWLVVGAGLMAWTLAFAAINLLLVKRTAPLLSYNIIVFNVGAYALYGVISTAYYAMRRSTAERGATWPALIMSEVHTYLFMLVTVGSFLYAVMLMDTKGDITDCEYMHWTAGVYGLAAAAAFWHFYPLADLAVSAVKPAAPMPPT